MMRNKEKSLNIAVIMKSKVMGSKAVMKRNIKEALKQALMWERKYKTWIMKGILQSMC